MYILWKFVHVYYSLYGANSPDMYLVSNPVSLYFAGTSSAYAHLSLRISRVRNALDEVKPLHWLTNLSLSLPLMHRKSFLSPKCYSVCGGIVHAKVESLGPKIAMMLNEVSFRPYSDTPKQWTPWMMWTLLNILTINFIPFHSKNITYCLLSNMMAIFRNILLWYA